MELKCGNTVSYWNPLGGGREEDRVYAVIIRIPGFGAPWISTDPRAPWHDTTQTARIRRVMPDPQQNFHEWTSYRRIEGELPKWPVLKHSLKVPKQKRDERNLNLTSPIFLVMLALNVKEIYESSIVTSL